MRSMTQPPGEMMSHPVGLPACRSWRIVPKKSALSWIASV